MSRALLFVMAVALGAVAWWWHSMPWWRHFMYVNKIENAVICAAVVAVACWVLDTALSRRRSRTVSPAQRGT